jgi:hypothetical protein
MRNAHVDPKKESAGTSCQSIIRRRPLILDNRIRLALGWVRAWRLMRTGPAESDTQHLRRRRVRSAPTSRARPTMTTL